MPALAIHLDAPLQSWGTSSRFQYRETDAFPGKSAIIGLIAAAMGIDKNAPDESSRIAPLTALRFTAIRLPRQRAITRLTDFHTIGGGYDKKGPPSEKMSIPRKASGAPFGTVITRRTYLTDAAFAAILEGESPLLEAIQAALLDPVWGVWFGRKTCIPASPLSPVLAPSPREALATLLQALGRDPAEIESLEGVTEADDGPGTWFQMDQPIAFGQHHGEIPAPYHSRPVRRITATNLP